MSEIQDYSEAHESFESIKQVDEHGNEFWYARSLAKLLDYRDFRNFTKVIKKAKTACEISGHGVSDHIVELNDKIEIGKGGAREMPSFALSRYACYLIIQNGDPTKPIIANLFRATQTEEKLKRGQVSNKHHTNQTHFEVGKKVRQTIAELGGTMPENLPTPDKSIQQIEKQHAQLESNKDDD